MAPHQSVSLDWLLGWLGVWLASVLVGLASRLTQHLAQRPENARNRAHGGGAAAFASLARVEGWWAWEDLNFRPHAYQARALTN